MEDDTFLTTRMIEKRDWMGENDVESANADGEDDAKAANADEEE